MTFCHNGYPAIPKGADASGTAPIFPFASVTLVNRFHLSTVHGKVNGRPHLVPLAPCAVAILRELQSLTGHGRFVFPGLLTGERSMSENTLRTALRRMGYTNDEMTPHGFRAMARTVLVEQLDVNPDVIEAQLAHGKSGPLGVAYDRAEFMTH